MRKVAGDGLRESFDAAIAAAVVPSSHHCGPAPAGPQMCRPKPGGFFNLWSTTCPIAIQVTMQVAARRVQIPAINRALIAALAMQTTARVATRAATLQRSNKTKVLPSKNPQRAPRIVPTNSREKRVNKATRTANAVRGFKPVRVSLSRSPLFFACNDLLGLLGDQQNRER